MFFPAKQNTRPNAVHYVGYGPELLTDGDMENGPGSEEITDGDMEAVGVAAWTVGNNATLTKDTTVPLYEGTQHLRVAFNGTANPYAYQIILTVGKTYRVTGAARGDGTYYPQVRFHGTTVWTGTTSTSWQTFDVSAVPTGTTLRLYSNVSGAGYVEFDDVSVVETCPDWTAVSSGLITKETGTPHGGSQCLRVSRNGVNSPGCEQSILTVGKKYLIEGYARSDGNALPQIWISGGLGEVWTGTSSTSWQHIRKIFTTTHADFTFYSVTSTGTEYTEWDDLTVTEINTTPDESKYNASHNYRQIELATDEASAVFTYITRGPAGTGFWVDWGDGSDREWIQHIGTGSNVTTNHTYDATVGTKPIIWQGVLTDITRFYCAEADNIMNIAALSIMKKLTSLTCKSSTDVTGDIAALAGLTSLVTLELSSSGVTGDIKDIATLASLTTLDLQSNTFAYTTTTLPAWAGTISLQNNAMTATEVDAFLVDLDTAGGSNGTLDISGTNAAPGAPGLTAKANLIGKGWTVTTN